MAATTGFDPGSSSRTSFENIRAIRSSGRPKHTTPQPSTAVSTSPRASPALLATTSEDLLLERMLGEVVSVQRPPSCPADEQHARMLPGAVVTEPASLHRSARKVVLGCPRALEERSHGGQLLLPGFVRRARDRQLFLRQLRVLESERKRLERLCGRPHVCR